MHERPLRLWEEEFWIVAADNQIEEFKVPKKPIKALSDSVGMPSSCAMDTSGDLAVGILNGSGSGDVVIYKNASGSGSVYEHAVGQRVLRRLRQPRESLRRRLHRLQLRARRASEGGQYVPNDHDEQLGGVPRSVQWDGTYLTVFDQYTSDIYQYTVSGTTATLKGTVSLTGSSDCGQTWIVKGLVYCGDAGNNDGEVFKYPAGGSPVAVLTGQFRFPARRNGSKEIIRVLLQ